RMAAHAGRGYPGRDAPRRRPHRRVEPRRELPGCLRARARAARAEPLDRHSLPRQQPEGAARAGRPRLAVPARADRRVARRRADVPELVAVVLDMKVLAELAPADVPARLAALPDAYARWIHEQRDRITDPAEGLEEYRDVAGAAMDACERTLVRIRAGLDLLA